VTTLHQWFADGADRSPGALGRGVGHPLLGRQRHPEVDEAVQDDHEGQDHQRELDCSRA